MTKLDTTSEYGPECLKTVNTTGPEGIRPHSEVTGQVAISLTQLSTNIRKRGSWGDQQAPIGEVVLYRGSK